MWILIQALWWQRQEPRNWSIWSWGFSMDPSFWSGKQIRKDNLSRSMMGLAFHFQSGLEHLCPSSKACWQRASCSGNKCWDQVENHSTILGPIYDRKCAKQRWEFETLDFQQPWQPLRHSVFSRGTQIFGVSHRKLVWISSIDVSNFYLFAIGQYSKSTTW